jgi:hypothetical protein
MRAYAGRREGADVFLTQLASHPQYRSVRTSFLLHSFSGVLGGVADLNASARIFYLTSATVHHDIFPTK